MGVAAARTALAGAPDGVSLRSLWFSTVAPPYLDKTNATAVHAALRLPSDAPAYDMNGAVRSAAGALWAGMATGKPALVVGADMRTGRPGSADEATGGDAASALLVGTADDGPLLAEVIGTGGATEEFLDRWRTPGDVGSKLWEERFGETRYVGLGIAAWEDALKTAGLTADQVDRVVIATSHARAATALGKKLALGDRLVAGLDATVGFTGTAQPGLLLAHALDTATPGQVVALVVLADGADVVLFRTTEALAAGRPASVGRRPGRRRGADRLRQVPRLAGLPARRAAPPPRARPPVGLGRRPVGRLEVRVRRLAGRRTARSTCRPPRPTTPPGPWPTPPARSSPRRSTGWPTRPRRRSCSRWSTSTAAAGCRSSSPTSTPTTWRSAGRVEMTFRKLFTADGIHNYFWKARPIRTGAAATGEGT